MVGFIRKKVHTHTLGEKLKMIRENANVSLNEISKATKVRKAYLEKLEVAEKLTSKSTFTTEDADAFGDKLKHDMWKRHKYYHQILKK